MTPFSGLLFFYTMALLLLPAIVLGLLEKPLKHYGMLFTTAMLVCTFSESGQLIGLVLFYLWQIALCTLFFRTRKARWKLVAAILLSLLPLAVVKVGEILPVSNVFQLLGVSYMTFRSVQVLLDSYDGKLKELRLSDLSYFLLFFPSVASGPIDRYRRFLGDLNRKLSRGEYIGLLRRGVWRLVLGSFRLV